jgi:beta-glucanase (GH16 family)
VSRNHRPSDRILALGTCALTLVVSAAACSKEPTEPEWTQFWGDEFNGPAGQRPDPGRWVFDIGTDWGNGQLEYDTDRPENVSLDGAGNLAITARLENYAGRNYTSGRIKTEGLFSQNGGRFEARMRMPSGRGLWPAFWLLGANYTTVAWPGCGEIDIMEYRGQEPTIVHGSLHGPGYSGGNAITRAFTAPDAPFDAAFHVYAVEWSSSKIDWSVDDVVYATTTAADIPGDDPWVFNHPFFIILNLAVGGSYVGPPDASTTFPQQLLVDYVRVYRRH